MERNKRKKRKITHTHTLIFFHSPRKWIGWDRGQSGHLVKWMRKAWRAEERKRKGVMEEMLATTSIVNEATVNDCLCERWSNINEPRKVWNYIEGNNAGASAESGQKREREEAK